jgi:hypothetical protein
MHALVSEGMSINFLACKAYTPGLVSEARNINSLKLTISEVRSINSLNLLILILGALTF